jgi:hypothetical protein
MASCWEVLLMDVGSREKSLLEPWLSRWFRRVRLKPWISKRASFDERLRGLTLKFSRREALGRLLVGGFATCTTLNESNEVAGAMVPSRQIHDPFYAPLKLPPIDAARIARRVVELFKPTAGERAIIVHDPTYYPQLTHLIYRELSVAGVHPIVALTFEPPEIMGPGVVDPVEAVRVLAADPVKSKKREAEAVAMLLPMFEKASIFLWLPARYTWPDLRWERLVGATRARGIHFHWISAPDRRNSEEIQMLTTMYERAVLETDYVKLSQEQDLLINAIRGQHIRIETADGTNLAMRVPQDAIFHKNDGDMSIERAKQARSVRDREMEVPAGALRFIPDSRSVEGRLVLRQVATRQGIAEGVTIEFGRGRAVRLASRKNEDGFRAEWQGVGGDVDKVGEIVIGTNPLLVGTTPSGELPYFGYGAGYLRVSLGENWESGGTNRSPLSRPLWFLLEHASLDAGTRPLIRDGRLVN